MTTDARPESPDVAKTLIDGALVAFRSNKGWADKAMFGALLSDIERLDPSTIISGHLPATSGAMIRSVLGNLLDAMTASRFGGPDRETIEGLFAKPMVA